MQHGIEKHLTLPTRAVAARTFRGYACEKLDALCAAARFDVWGRARARAELTAVLLPWGEEQIGERPRQPSALSDDHFPLEFSMTFTGGEPEVRVLFEPQATRASQTRWQAAAELQPRLAASPGVDLTRLAAIQDLFEPTAMAGWSAWFSLRFSSHRPTKYKIYLNPEAQGVDHSVARVSEALRRLGFSEYADELRSALLPNEELKFFSLDLDDGPRARVKVYAIQRGATRESIGRVLRSAAGFSQAGFDTFWEAIPQADGPFVGWPVSTYLSLVSGDVRPSASTVHFPTRAYTASDLATHQRVCQLLTGADLVAYQRAITAFAERPLAAGTGMHAYVSFGQERGASRITVYLACEAYGDEQAASLVRVGSQKAGLQP